VANPELAGIEVESAAPVLGGIELELYGSIQAPFTLAVDTTAVAGGVVNTAYTAQLHASGGQQAYAWDVSVGALPSGLSLNASTGAITGTPTLAETQAFTVRVTDALESADTQALSITIAAAAAGGAGRTAGSISKAPSQVGV